MLIGLQVRHCNTASFVFSMQMGTLETYVKVELARLDGSSLAVSPQNLMAMDHRISDINASVMQVIR
jgi:hypothetical protein